MTNNLNNRSDSFKNEDKDLLVHEIKELFTKIVMRQLSEDDDEKQWILNNCKNPLLLKKLDNMTVIMLHVLDAVGRLEPVNSITISRDTNIPKGTVSKVIPKLISKDLISKSPLPNNKKEYLFRITPLGQELFLLHQGLHKAMETGINTFLTNYNTQELQLVIRMLTDFNNTSWPYNLR